MSGFAGEAGASEGEPFIVRSDLDKRKADVRKCGPAIRGLSSAHPCASHRGNHSSSVPVRPTYHTTDAFGMTRICPDPDGLREVLESLEEAEEADFPDVSLIHVSGWTITVDIRWTAVLERMQPPEAPLRLIRLEGLADALALWLLLARGDLEAVLQLPWAEPQD